MTTIDRPLQSIGHRCFRICYETAVRRGEAFGMADLLRCDPALRETSPKALATRASKIRKLVREGQAGAALAIVERGIGNGLGIDSGTGKPNPFCRTLCWTNWDWEMDRRGLKFVCYADDGAPRRRDEEVLMT